MAKSELDSVCVTLPIPSDLPLPASQRGIPPASSPARREDWRVAPPGQAAVRHLKLGDVDEAARTTGPSASRGLCVDELCACSLHKCLAQSAPVPFDADTTYRSEFKAKELPRKAPLAPNQPYASLPFDADTAYRSDYKKYDIAKRPEAAQLAYEAAKDSRDFVTESRSQFCTKAIPARIPSKDLPPVESLPFDATTTYRSEFLKKELPRPAAVPSAELAKSLPFDATTHYRDAFKAWPVAKRGEVSTPAFEATPDGRDFATQYRSAYKGVMPVVCPVTRLPPYPMPPFPREHSFWDPIAKQWY